MEIFNGMDSSDFLMKGELVPGNYVFKAPEKPKIFDCKKKKAQKQQEYDNAITFFSNLDSWNKDGFDTLATVLSLLEEDINKISLIDLNPKSLSFAFLSDNEKVEVKLIPRAGRECPPMITIQKGNITKKYICENIFKKGLLINLISLTVRNYDRSVTREFLSDSYSIIIRGLGYSTEITMHRNPACSKLLLNEEDLLKALLEKGAFDVMKAFRLLHLYASKEMTYKTVNIRLYKEPDEYSLSSQWELLQSLKVFSGCLFKYESKDPLAGMFSRTLSYESQDYLDHISGNIRHEHTQKVFKKEQQKCEDFVSFLNFYNNDEATKELSLTNY